MEWILRDTTLYALPLAFILGAAVGAEREWRRKPGGLRTSTLVALASAAFADLMLSQVSPTNLGAGYGAVATGVGFLGAGAILKEGASVRGLATAATIWCVAAIGLLAGAGEVVGAVLLTLIVLAVNTVLRPISRLIRRRRPAAARDEMEESPTEH